MRPAVKCCVKRFNKFRKCDFSAIRLDFFLRHTSTSEVNLKLPYCLQKAFIPRHWLLFIVVQVDVFGDCSDYFPLTSLSLKFAVLLHKEILLLKSFASERNQFNILKRDFLVNYVCWGCLSLKLDFVCLVFSCHWINNFNALWLFLFSRRFSFKLLFHLLPPFWDWLWLKTFWMLLNFSKLSSTDSSK